MANTKTRSDVAAWYAMSQAEVVQRLVTNPEKGLNVLEASTRRRQYGPNRLPEGRKRGAFTRFFAQFNNILIYVLIAAGFIKLMLSLWIDAGIIFTVVVLNALLGFIQEGKAEKALDSIRNMLSPEARTLRGGETRIIAAEQLVPGDIVLVESGDRIPADLRLLDAKNLRTEEAALTGESVPAEKTARQLDAALADMRVERLAAMPVLQILDELGRVGAQRRVADLCFARLGPARADVVAD
jgi:magnesium-transporting ATPase (P-type)